MMRAKHCQGPRHAVYARQEQASQRAFPCARRRSGGRRARRRSASPLILTETAPRNRDRYRLLRSYARSSVPAFADRHGRSRPRAISMSTFITPSRDVGIALGQAFAKALGGSRASRAMPIADADGRDADACRDRCFRASLSGLPVRVLCPEDRCLRYRIGA